MSRSLVLALCGLALTLPSPVRAQGPMFLGKSVGDWQANLRSTDVAVRRSAAFALGKISGTNKAVVAALVQRLNGDSDAGVRSNAASALGNIATAYGLSADRWWPQAGAALEKALKSDASAGVRRSAAYALGAFGSNAAEAVPTLRAALKQENASVRRNAAWALGRLGADAAGTAAGDLCGLLQDRNALVRRDAAVALGALGSSAATVGGPALLDLVKNEQDGVVQKAALDALSHIIGPDQRKSAKMLYPLLISKDPEVARGAAFILGNMGGEEAKRAVPILRTALRDPDPEVQGMAALSLSNLGFNAYPAIGDLANALELDRNPSLRTNAANALSHIGAGIQELERGRDDLTEAQRRSVEEVRKMLAGRAVPALIKGLRASQMDVRKFSAEALARIDYPTNKAAIPALLGALANKNNARDVRQRCIWAFFGVNDLSTYPAAVKALTNVLHETDPEMTLVRYDAARALAYALRADAPDKAVDVLLHMLNNKDLFVYHSTDGRVTGVGNEAQKGAANVKANLGGDARYMAAQALGRMAAKAAGREDVRRALRAAAKNGDARLMKEAKRAIENLGI